MLRSIILTLCGLLLSVSLYAAEITNLGKPKARILVDKTNLIDLRAAELMARFITEISDAKILILDKSSTKEGVSDIIIGSDTPSDLLKHDGYSIEIKNGKTHITSGGGKGSIYGVVYYLEQLLGVNYYAKDSYEFSKRGTISVPNNYSKISNPAFSYRQSQSYGAEDPAYYDWFAMESPKEVFAANLWVHTFKNLMPTSIYATEHPEYYSLIGGTRRPGTESQLCLTNEEVFEEMAVRIDSIFAANPAMDIISVSQNDGNYTNCTCPKCAELDSLEGSPSATLVYFLNKLAARRPDKQFSTLAYLYSMNPPKTIKPLPNVNIMLCNIDCMREVPLTDNASGKYFMKALEGWSKISDNIFIWNYGINFDNCVAPFPNFHILQPNIQLFKKHNATMVFEQVNGYKGVDFAELRAYMIGKLLWDPYIDADSIKKHFLNGYYKAAAPYLYDYLKLQEGGLISSGKGLWIYDSPVTHKDGFLNANMVKRYNELFDKAEKSVAADSVLLDRVRLSRLPLQYAELEIARANGITDALAIESKIALFEQRTAYFGVNSLNERNNSPADYCTNYRVRYMPRAQKNIASNSKIEWITAPTKEIYKTKGETALTDNLYGGTAFVESWVGWEGSHGAFILDMGKEKEFSAIESDFLHQLGQWVFLPKGVKYSVSSDGINFTEFGLSYQPEIQSGQVLFVPFKATAKATKARYIKVEIESIVECPTWHNGIGHPAWFFIDEVYVTK